MFGSLRSLMLAALIAPGITFAASIDDGAKLFSKEAVEKAERTIDQIKRDYRRDVVIETFAEAKDVDRAKAEKGEYFTSWVKQRYKDRHVAGVYILICKKPTWIQVAAGPVTEKMGIDRSRRDAIHDVMNTAFQEKDNPERFDKGLLAAVNTIQGTFADLNRKVGEAPRGGAASPDTDGGMTWVGWVVTILVVLIVAWLVVGLIRAFSGGGGGGYGGGGGFFPSLMGGLLGAAAGMYLYNTFFNPGYHHDQSAGYDPNAGMNDGDPNTEGGGGWNEPDNSADGGGAGGDWGGGDEGGAGGDWGGDAGGGGDWGGGGGGDW